MPFAVSQWPYSPDPRGPAYIVQGWDFGQLPSWKWDLGTTGATGDLAVFNAGVRFHNVSNTPQFGDFDPDVVLEHDLEVLFEIQTNQIPQGSPPPWTVRILIQISRGVTPLYSVLFPQLFPTAIQVQGPFAMTEIDTSSGTIPNPMTITPAKWDA